MLPSKYHLFATGTTSGLTVASLGEFLRDVNWQNALTVLVSVGSAGVSWYVSVRQARREQDRLDREEARQQRMEDALVELRIKKAETGSLTEPAPATPGAPAS